MKERGKIEKKIENRKLQQENELENLPNEIKINNNKLEDFNKIIIIIITIIIKIITIEP